MAAKLILGVDTAGKNGSLALVKCAEVNCETVDLVPLSGGSYSAELIPRLAEMLERSGLTRQAVDGFAVASGPGSFTGLRVGLSAVKALAEILQRPIAAVSVLQALASVSPEPGRVLAALDDNRGHVYTGDYYAHAGKLPIAREELLLSMDEFVQRASRVTVVCSDAKLAEALGKRAVSATIVERPQADVVARIGYQKIVAGEIAPPETLEANYIRRSDAELFGKPTY